MPNHAMLCHVMINIISLKREKLAVDLTGAINKNINLQQEETNLVLIALLINLTFRS